MVNSSQLVEIINLSKRYRSKLVLNNVSFSLVEGEVLGILGPNGAGKTTLLKIISGLAKPSEGRVIMSGLAANQIATIFEDQRFLGQLSGIKNIRLFLKTIGEGELSLEKKFEQYGLGESKSVSYRAYSAGMKKRMDLMSVFVSGKRLFLLDEPTNAVDIDGAMAFNEQVRSLKAEGKSFIVSSHHALELERMCDRFLLINRGVLIAKMNKEDVFNNFDSLEGAYRSLITNHETRNL